MALVIKNLDLLRKSLAKHEGVRTRPYVDSVGKLTIGVGHNLTDNGISPRIISLLLDEDILKATNLIDHYLPWVNTLDDVRKRVFVELAFNLGNRLLEFANTLKCAENHDWKGCIQGLQSSLWHKQVGKRAETLEGMLLSGLDPS